MNSKFIYKENDIQIAHCQCEFCIYNRKETPMTCEQYETKPEEVIRNQKRCPREKDIHETPW